MKIHIVTVGSPKLAYATLGWEECIKRLQHYHDVRITHISNKQNDATHLLEAAKTTHLVALVIDGPQMNSEQLATFLDKKAYEAREVCFMIGGPDGLPEAVIQQADTMWSMSKLTFPHDLAMVILAETLYRSSTINDGLPYHH